MTSTQRWISILKNVAIVGGVAITAATFVGCKSQTTGNEGNFQFSYVADDDIRDFNKPIAVGGRLNIEVREVGTNKPVMLSDAMFDKSEVLTVVTTTGNVVTVEGASEGGALLTVNGAVAGGEPSMDSVNLLSRVPEVTKLAHTCNEGETGYYLTSQRVWIPYELERANGQPVIGYNYYPFTFEPAEGLTHDLSIEAQQFLHVDTADSPQTVTISSEIDGTKVNVELLDEASIMGAMFAVGEPVIIAEVNKQRFYHVLPTTAEGNPICQAVTEVDVVSDTPQTCTVRELNEPPQEEVEGALEGGENEFGWLEIVGVEAGTCNFTVTYPMGNNGEGASTQLTIEVEP